MSGGFLHEVKTWRVLNEVLEFAEMHKRQRVARLVKSILRLLGGQAAPGVSQARQRATASLGQNVRLGCL